MRITLADETVSVATDMLSIRYQSIQSEIRTTRQMKSFTKIFSKRTWELASAHVNYDACKKEALDVRRELRKNLLEYFSEEGQDPVILKSLFSKYFILMSRSEGAVFTGYFIDEFTSNIDKIKDDNDLDEINQAISRYKQDRIGRGSYVARSKYRACNEATKDLDFSDIERFKKEGFIINDQARIDHIVGWSLVFDGEVIAKSRINKPQITSEAALFGRIMKALSSDREIHSIELHCIHMPLIDMGIMTLRKIPPYKYTYSNIENAKDKESMKDFEEQAINLLNFMNILEMDFITNSFYIMEEVTTQESISYDELDEFLNAPEQYDPIPW